MDFLTFENVRHAAYVGDGLAYFGLQSWGDTFKAVAAVLFALTVAWGLYRRARPAAPPSVVAARVLAALEGESIWVRRAPKPVATDVPKTVSESISPSPCKGLDGDLAAANLHIVYVGDQMTEAKAGTHDCLRHMSRGEIRRVQRKARAVILAHEEAERKAQEAATAAAVSGAGQTSLPRSAGRTATPVEVEALIAGCSPPPVNSMPRKT